MIPNLKPYPAMRESGVPRLEEGGIEAFRRREVLPHGADLLAPKKETEGLPARAR
ncbi:MAG TPA: hypothetical protein VGA37_09410 [Gemmatimonadales bacterium]